MSNKYLASVIVLILPILSAAQTAVNEPISMTADKGESDFTKGITLLTGNVVIVQGTANLKADRVELRLDESSRAESMLATGNPAKFIYKGKKLPIKATANKIEYNVLNYQIIMTGNAEVLQGKDKLKGDRLVYDLNQEVLNGTKVNMTYDPATKKNN